MVRAEVEIPVRRLSAKASATMEDDLCKGNDSRSGGLRRHKPQGLRVREAGGRASGGRAGGLTETASLGVGGGCCQTSWQGRQVQTQVCISGL